MMTEEMKRKPSFYIEQILSPDFGSQSKFPNEAHQEQRSIDSHKNEVIHKETLKSKQLQDDSSKMSTEDRFKSRATSDSPFVPAWIFCTRYSDRPASGTMHSPLINAQIWIFYFSLAKIMVVRSSHTEAFKQTSRGGLVGRASAS